MIRQGAHIDDEKPIYKLKIDRTLDVNHDGKLGFADVQRISLQQWKGWLFLSKQDSVLPNEHRIGTDYNGTASNAVLF